jgi:hypothetical protein
MRKMGLIIASLTGLLVLGGLLLACDLEEATGSPAPVPFDALANDPHRYEGRYVCTQGTRVDGFEVSGLGAGMVEQDGRTHLTEPVIWLEHADVQSREDCIQTATLPSFEFCQVVVCGVFESGGGFGHAGAYQHQLWGSAVRVAPAYSGDRRVGPG